LDEHLSAGDVRAAFAYLPCDDSRSFAWLDREGYQVAGEMLVMACAVDRVSKTAKDVSLSLHRYDSTRQQDLMELVKRTYADTLDFPTQGRIRHTGDVLARYAEAGASGTTHWWFVGSGDRDVGCLLLADHRQQNQCELVYMGLVPEARGNRWGRQIVAYALQAARDIERRQMLLGVDAQNDPAIATYAAAGFVEQNRRSVLSKVFR